MICVDSGYDIVFAGAGGLDIQGTQALCHADSEDGGDRNHRGAFVQLYREQAPLPRAHLQMGRSASASTRSRRRSSTTLDEARARSTTASCFSQSSPRPIRGRERVAGKDAHEFAPIADLALAADVTP